MTVDLDAEARSVVREAISGLSASVKACNKILAHLEAHVTVAKASEGAQPYQDQAQEPEQREAPVSSSQGHVRKSVPLSPEDLAHLANALAAVAGTLLRVFNK